MKVDISGVNVEKFDDKYFVREKKATKTEGELFIHRRCNQGPATAQEGRPEGGGRLVDQSY